MPILTTTYDSVSSSNAITITLAGQLTSATFVAGQQSTVVDNTTTNFIDCIVSGQVTVGTTPTTAKQIVVYVYAPLKVAAGTFTYPIATATELTGTNGTATFEIDQLNKLRFADAANVIATSDRAYSFAPFSVAALFGGVMPLKWGLYVAHNTVAALNATAGNHFFHWTGIKYTST